jgi:peptidoglycan/xylan/chitin deacetylase (PgdA/CDA1 family)
LRHHGCAGTYYASFGLMGRDTSTGRIFEAVDLEALVAQGHELGCHTFDHCHSWDTSPREFEASIRRNRQAISRLLPGVELTSFSYPISCPRPQTKRRTARYYPCLRGGGQTFNAGKTDMNYMKAFFLEQSINDLDAIKRNIDVSIREHGWLIFATHDVRESPTRFGCTPRFFEQVVEYAAKSGAVLLPVHEAWQRIQSQSPLPAGFHPVNAASSN